MLFVQEQRKREREEEDRRLAEMRAQEEARRKSEEVRVSPGFSLHSKLYPSLEIFHMRIRVRIGY